jgi:hypothetical protein
MRTFIKLLFLSALVTAGCSKKSNSPEPAAPTGAEGGSADTVLAGTCKDGGSPQAEGATCAAIFEGCCYPDPAAACAAAGCAEDCIQAESLPVQVSCPAKTDAPAPQ